MSENQSVLSAKLHELEKEYEELHSRLQACQQQNAQTLFREIQRLKVEDEARDVLLGKAADGSHCMSVSRLAHAQLDYRQRVERELEYALAECGSLEECAESLALYAEYAIDFATQSMRYALLSSCMAMELHMSLEEKWQEVKNYLSTQGGSRNE